MKKINMRWVAFTFVVLLFSTLHGQQKSPTCESCGEGIYVYDDMPIDPPDTSFIVEERSIERKERLGPLRSPDETGVSYTILERSGDILRVSRELSELEAKSYLEHGVLRKPTFTRPGDTFKGMEWTFFKRSSDPQDAPYEMPSEQPEAPPQLPDYKPTQSYSLPPPYAGQTYSPPPLPAQRQGWEGNTYYFNDNLSLTVECGRAETPMERFDRECAEARAVERRLHNFFLSATPSQLLQAIRDENFDHQECLQDHDKYRYPAYRDAMKHLPGYANYIKKLKERLDDPAHYKERDAFGWPYKKKNRIFRSSEDEAGFYEYIKSEYRRLFGKQMATEAFNELNASFDHARSEHQRQHRGVLQEAWQQMDELEQEEEHAQRQKNGGGAGGGGDGGGGGEPPRDPRFDEQKIAQNRSYFAEQKKKAWCSWKKEYAQLGSEVIDRCEEFRQWNNNTVAYRYYQRMEAIAESLKDPKRKELKGTSFSSEELKFARSADCDLSDLTTREGNPFQSRLYDELESTVRKAYLLDNAYGHTYDITSYHQLLLRGNAMATYFVKKNDMRRATGLTDFCHALNEAAAQCARDLRGLGSCISRAAEPIIRMVDRTIELTGEKVLTQLQAMAKEPLKTAARITLWNAAPQLALATMVYDALKNRKAIVKAVRHLYETGCANTPEAAAQVTSELMSLVLIGKFEGRLSKIPKELAPHVKKFSEWALRGRKLERGTVAAGVDMPVTVPVNQIVHDTREMMDLARDYEPKQVKNAIKTMQEQNFHPQKNSVDLLQRALMEVEEGKKLLFNWGHIIRAEVGRDFKKGLDTIKGYHYKRVNFYQEGKITVLPNDQGVYKQMITYNGISAEKTFFPDHWNEATLVKKLKEAFNNKIPKSEKNSGFRGKTSEGITIQFWFSYNKELNRYWINSAYPIL